MKKPSRLATRYRIIVTRKILDQLKADPYVIVMEALRWDEKVDRWECYVEAVGEPPAAILKGVEAYDQWRNSGRGAKRKIHQGAGEET